jgi:hypothetical protein
MPDLLKSGIDISGVVTEREAEKINRDVFSEESSVGDSV